MFDGDVDGSTAGLKAVVKERPKRNATEWAVVALDTSKCVW
jgi:hypothetical protein